MGTESYLHYVAHLHRLIVDCENLVPAKYKRLHELVLGYVQQGRHKRLRDIRISTTRYILKRLASFSSKFTISLSVDVIWKWTV